jgi:hypothetical protein
MPLLWGYLHTRYPPRSSLIPYPGVGPPTWTHTSRIKSIRIKSTSIKSV